MEQTDRFAGLGLYFPTMLIRDDAWLRSAFLSWNKLTRIAPTSRVYGDSPIVERLIDEVGFISSTPPSNEEIENVGREFAEVVSVYGDSPMFDRLRIRDSQGVLLPEVRGSHGSWNNAPTPPGANLTYILTETIEGERGKLSEMLRGLLQSQGLAISWSDGRGSYLGVHPRLGWTYMSRLTQVMAQNRRYSPVTDIPDAYTACTFPDVDSIARFLLYVEPEISARSTEDLDRRQLFLQVALADAIPSNLDNISWSRLIAFRKHHGDDLDAFYKHISDLSSKLTAIGDVADSAALMAHIEGVYRQETRPMVNRLRRALKSAGIDALGGALVLKVDVTSIAGTALGASAIAAGGPPVLTAAGVAAAIVPSIAANWRRQRQEVLDSPVSYLLAAEKLGSPASILRHISPSRRRR